MLTTMRRRAQFDAVLKGNIVGRTPHFALHARRVADADGLADGLFRAGTCHVGVMVPKRWARRAATRSLIKRQMRAVMAAHAQRVPAHTALVLRLRAEFDRQVFVSAQSAPLRQAVRQELHQLLDKARWPVAPPQPHVPQPSISPPADVTASGTIHAAP